MYASQTELPLADWCCFKVMGVVRRVKVLNVGFLVSLCPVVFELCLVATDMSVRKLRM